jgi:hypothetical protein
MDGCILFILGIKDLIHRRSMPSKYEPSSSKNPKRKMVIFLKTALMSVIKFQSFMETTSSNETSEMVCS